MSNRDFTILDFCTIVVLGGVCLTVAAVFFLPNIEEGRNEARLNYAYGSVLMIRDVHTGQREKAELPTEENDPWGNPYRVETMADGHVRVVSSGPNGTSPALGVDENDIHSDMAVSPAKPIGDRKRHQILLTLSGVFVAWILLSVLWMRCNRVSAI